MPKRTAHTPESEQWVQQACLNLAKLGEALDRYESRVVAMDPRKYRKLSLQAGLLLKDAADLDPLRRTCVAYHSTRELLQNELFNRAHARGRVQWLYEVRFK